MDKQLPEKKGQPAVSGVLGAIGTQIGCGKRSGVCVYRCLAYFARAGCGKALAFWRSPERGTMSTSCNEPPKIEYTCGNLDNQNRTVINPSSSVCPPPLPACVRQRDGDTPCIPVLVPSRPGIPETVVCPNLIKNYDNTHTKH